jgi:glycosyltransferase involved in cell wall biosynthesis
MEEVETPRKVSVVIVSYNCVAALRRCLDALGRSASPEMFEVLVVDNGSRDESGLVDRDSLTSPFCASHGISG